MSNKKNQLRLYVWKDVLCDYTCGIMFALASDVESARDEIRKACPHVNEDELEQEPEILDTPKGFYVWGGG